jgi:hypothetical protein
MDPGLLAAAFCDRRKARLFLEFVGGGQAFPLGAEGDEEAGSKDGPSPWQGVKPRAVRRVRSALGDGFVAVGKGRQGNSALGDEGVPEEDMGGNDACIGGQRSGALDGLDAGGNHIGRPHVVGPEEAGQGRATRALGAFEGRPAAQEVTKDRRLLLLKPLEDMRAGVFERTGHAVGQTDFGTAQATVVLDEVRSGAPGGAWGAEWGARVAVCEEALTLACGIGGVLLGPARGKCGTVLGHGERMDGKEHEDFLVAQRGHQRPLRECQAHSDGWSVESCA